MHIATVNCDELNTKQNEMKKKNQQNEHFGSDMVASASILQVPVYLRIY